jgi:hypothetical protein
MNELKKLLSELYDKFEIDEEERSLETLEELFGDTFSLLIDFLPLKKALRYFLTATQADGEDIVEGGAEEILRQITPHLKSQGIEILEIKNAEDDEDKRTSYELLIRFSVLGEKAKTQTLTIWTQEELDSEKLWFLSVSRLLGFINKLLNSANSTDRFILASDSMQMFLPCELTTSYTSLLLPTKREAHNL